MNLILAVIFALAALVWQPAQTRSPSVVLAVTPVYPPLAVLSATSGDVQVDLSINDKGQVVTAVPANGHQLLNRAAEEAAVRWQFEPGGNGRKVRLVFNFRIMPKGTHDSELTPSFSPPYRCEVRRTVPDIPPDR